MSKQSGQERISEKLISGNNQKGKTGIIPIVVIAVVAVVLIMALAFVLIRQSPEETVERNAVITPDNVDEVIAEMNEQHVEAGTYEVTMNTTWHFDKGDEASVDAYVENSTSNTNDVYFDIVRSDTGETIFASPIIPVGSHLENITLDEALEAGTHDCVLTYYLLDEDGNAISKLNISLSIVVAD